MNESFYLDDDDPCAVECSDRRFYMAVAGTLLSFVSLFCNVLIAKVLYSSNHGHFFFLALLAISDSFLSFMYGPVIAMDIIKDKLKVKNSMKSLNLIVFEVLTENEIFWTIFICV
ncbi:unnamed protein product [Angiostrongylus costaricensis]|uniref:G_PROTEIN_RECEP_F1_2 domain-containing protein n=1 Tax=Angiostrongylus costaricensis TaxID=334426 RepID=A0A0R3PGU7_ANGCS|nr:unnamed protein product [Angiostrongylus costaricensis]